MIITMEGYFQLHFTNERKMRQISDLPRSNAEVRVRAIIRLELLVCTHCWLITVLTLFE